MVVALDHIRAWLINLSQHVGPTQGTGDLAGAIESTAAMLTSKAPVSLFTADSLEFCLRKFEFFPTYAKLWARLQTYQREQSNQRALAAPSVNARYPGTEHLSVDDAQQASVWMQRFASGNRTDLEVRLAVVRRYAPAAYRWIIDSKTDAAMYAAEIAVRNNWTYEVAAPEERESASRIPTPQQQAEIRADSGIVRISPGVDVIPPSVSDTFEEKHGRRPGALTPEQLAVVRSAANGPKVPQPGVKPRANVRVPANDPPPAPRNFFDL